MKRFIFVLVFALAACGKQNHGSTVQAPPQSVTPAAAAGPQSKMPENATAEMKLIPIPKDKGQLGRLIAMGYTVHQNHMHPPGVRSCPFDKTGGSVVE